MKLDPQRELLRERKTIANFLRRKLAVVNFFLQQMEDVEDLSYPLPGVAETFELIVMAHWLGRELEIVEAALAGKHLGRNGVRRAGQ